jgi:hypothetical protein
LVKKVYLERVLPNTVAVNCKSILIILSSERVEVICFDVTCFETIGYTLLFLCFEAIFFNSYLILFTKMTSFVFFGSAPKGKRVALTCGEFNLSPSCTGTCRSNTGDKTFLQVLLDNPIIRYICLLIDSYFHKCTKNTVMSYVTQGRHGLVLRLLHPCLLTGFNSDLFLCIIGHDLREKV